MLAMHAGTLALLARDGANGSVDIGSILGYIVVGVVVGLLARLIIPGRDPMGILATIVLGIVGAVIGGWLAGAVFSETAGVDWVASILVAAALVLVARSVRSHA
jgi:uncharacterized membrane protein YeaQ/YmgE (transglycosylase-associated protein family)